VGGGQVQPATHEDTLNGGKEWCEEPALSAFAMRRSPPKSGYTETTNNRVKDNPVDGL